MGTEYQSQRSGGYPSQTSTKKKKSEKIVSFLKTALCILFLGACLLYALNMKSIRETSTGSDMLGPEIFGLRIYHTLSPSMTPTIQVGGIIFSMKKPVDKIRPGDILSYLPQSSDEVVLTHRVMEVYEEDGEPRFITQGDANNSSDVHPVTGEQALGVAVFWVNGLEMLFTPPGLIILGCAVVIIFFVLPTIFDIIRERFRVRK